MSAALEDERVKLNLLRCSHMTSIANYVHFNNAGASPIPLPIHNYVKEVLDMEHLVGGYEAQRQHADELSEVYNSVGRLICAPNPQHEIALVDSATSAWVKAFYSIPLSAGDIVLVSKVEYAANYVAILQQTRRLGAEIICIPSDDHGCVSLSALEALLQQHSNVRVVCITWIPTNGGVVNDARAIGELCDQSVYRSKDSNDTSKIFYLLDGCQAAGQIHIDVTALKCDMLSATGRKYLRGPRGTGFLYISTAALLAVREPVTIDHAAAPWVKRSSSSCSAATDRGDDAYDYTILPSARRYEQWEKNIAGLLGMGRCIEYFLDTAGPGWAESRICCLGRRLRQSLIEINAHRKSVDGDVGHLVVRDLGNSGDSKTQCGIVTFSIVGFSAVEVVNYLAKRSGNSEVDESTAPTVYASVTSPPSTLMDATERELPDMIRMSVHYFNTEEEIGIVCGMIESMISRK